MYKSGQAARFQAVLSSKPQHIVGHAPPVEKNLVLYHSRPMMSSPMTWGIHGVIMGWLRVLLPCFPGRKGRKRPLHNEHVVQRAR